MLLRSITRAVVVVMLVIHIEENILLEGSVLSFALFEFLEKRGGRLD